MGLDVLTQKLVGERAELATRADGILRTTAEEDRDLTDIERNSLTSFRSRIDSIDGQLELTTRSLELDAGIAERLTQFGGPTIVRAQNPWEGATAGQVVWDWLHRSHDRDAGRRVESFQRHMSHRAAEHMGTTAANTVAVAGGFGGLLVSASVGPIIDLGWKGMPFTTALGYTDLPTAATFMRPRLIDPDSDAAGPQAGGKEKAELPSKHFDLVADPITLAGVGNYLNLSIQAETMVPGALDIVVSQLNRRTVRGVENTTVAKLTGTSKKITLAADADSAALLVAIGEATAWIWQTTGQGPEWIAYGPQGAGRLIGITDLAGRPLFPFVGASNAAGSSSATAETGVVGTIGGLRPILTPGIKDGAFYIGNEIGLEVYLHRLPLLSVLEPSILGRQLASAALVGTYQAPTTEATTTPTPALYEAVVKLAP
jgi:hypothetical protein